LSQPLIFTDALGYGKRLISPQIYAEIADKAKKLAANRANLTNQEKSNSCLFAKFAAEFSDRVYLRKSAAKGF